MSNDLTPPILDLFGDPNENFYQLGIRDRGQYLPTLNHLKSLFQTGQAVIDLSIRSGLNLFSQYSIKKMPQDYQYWIEAYCEGLAINPQQYIGTLLLPEFMSSLAKFVPQIPKNFLGCSSLFYFDEQAQHTYHGRILDFPLLSSFDRGEQLLRFQFTDQEKVLSHSSAGLPLAGLTAMNASGMTIAVHQKFNTSFHHDGTPIFVIIDYLIRHCKTKNEMKNELKKFKSMTKWCVLASFPGGEILIIDKDGDDYQEIDKTLSPGEFFYHNNVPMKKENIFLPIGMTHYCLKRTQMVEEKLSLLNQRKKNRSLTSLDLLMILAKPLESTQCILDCTTPSSLTIGVANALNGEYHYIPTPAPKVMLHESTKLKGIWSKEKVQIHQEKNKPSSYDLHYHKSMKHFMLAQVAFDQKNKNDCLHHIQMAENLLLKNNQYSLCRLYNLTFQYLFTKRKEQKEILLLEFIQLHKAISDPWCDHVILFIMRLEKILDKSVTVSAEQIKMPYLKKVFLFEYQLRPMILNLLKKMIIPRIDIADIIYLYYKEDS